MEFQVRGGPYSARPDGVPLVGGVCLELPRGQLKCKLELLNGAGEDRDGLPGCGREWMAERRSRRASLSSLQLLVWAVAPLVLGAS